MQASKPRTVDAAVGKWPGILAALGVDEKYLGRKHTECPFCGGKDRFRFSDKDGTGAFICGQCGAGSGIEFLIRLHGWSFAEAAKNVDSVIGNIKISDRREERTEAQKVEAIKRVLKDCKVVERGDPVWLYLNRRTGIEEIPSDLKFHPGLYHSSGGQHPAMIAVVRDRFGIGVTLHRTYLTIAGEKANVDPVKMFMAGKRLNGASVRLSRAQECIGIAEGIETSLAASMRFGVPVWAATNSVLLDQWLPPDGVRKVVICGDNDSSYTGHAAAYSLARRLHRDGCEVEVRIPESVDRDWCDEGQ